MTKKEEKYAKDWSIYFLSLYLKDPVDWMFLISASRLFQSLLH